MSFTQIKAKGKYQLHFTQILSLNNAFLLYIIEPDSIGAFDNAGKQDIIVFGAC